MSRELKSCPFCGSYDLKTYIPDHIDYQCVSCCNCNACGPLVNCIGGWEKANHSWNKRTTGDENVDTNMDFSKNLWKRWGKLPF